MDLTLILILLLVIGIFVYIGYRKKLERTKEGHPDSDTEESSIDKHKEKNTGHRN